MDDVLDFESYISVITNLSPDHLERYNNNFQEYVDSKFKIISNHSSRNYFVFNYDDKKINQEIKIREIKSKKISFSLKNNINNNLININVNNNNLMIPLENLSLKGR